MIFIRPSYWTLIHLLTDLIVLSNKAKAYIMATAIIKPDNLKEVYFNYTTRTRITGNPTYSDLHKIYCQDKANAQSVPITLWGGDNVHLGLILSYVTYQQTFPGTQNTRPVTQDSLTNNTGTAGVITQWFTLHNCDAVAAQGANQVEKNILNQITEVIDIKPPILYIN